MRWVAPVVLLLSGCASYDSFTLPQTGGGEEGAYRMVLDPGPVLEPDAGSWDSSDVLNPSIVRFQGRLLNLYSGFDGTTWHTGLAESGDGRTWRKLGRILSPDPASWEGDRYIAANGAAVVWRGEVWYYFQAGRKPRVGLLRSRDGRKWERHKDPVIPVGPRGSWDELGVADPYVLEVDGKLYLYYLGMDRAKRQRLGVARSEDGVQWTKLRSNPVMELGSAEAFDGGGLGEPAVWRARGWYWMLYTGRARNEQRRLALVRSRDGVRWSAPLWVAGGDAAWNREVVCDPEVDAGSGQVWFGGGDKASPDERLNGKIGTGRLEFR